ncbi:bifunctional riboflavin kinase/FAD synthetase [Glaciecola sp. 1036]|uniref:bifunctional riboflavin kinase/FAD synthetase n=1 Tax=Alteromonadaceae TaxID=72275 RepID=UPI003CFD8ACF
MLLIRGIQNIKPEHHGCVLTIGKFDGVHFGHRAVLDSLVKKARELGVPAAVMVFEPQPEEYFAPELAPARLSTLRDKFVLLDQIGIERLICVRFDETFSKQSPTEFVQHLLVEKLGVQFLVVGDDFKFGYKRKGDFAFLQSSGENSGFKVVSTQSYRLDDCRISSTEIRRALANDDFAYAKSMLGRPYALSGKVVHGEKNGRTIGFPTANIVIKKQKAPVSGVFAVTARIDGNRYQGVANLGVRPTLLGQRLQLETHIFDFSGDLYGKHMTVEFWGKLRDEMKFDSFEQLKTQIELDAKQARDLFQHKYNNGNQYE